MYFSTQIILVSVLINILLCCIIKTKAKDQNSSKFSTILNFIIDLQQDMITIISVGTIIKILEDDVKLSCNNELIYY